MAEDITPQLTIPEALQLAEQYENQFRAFHRLREFTQLLADHERLLSEREPLVAKQASDLATLQADTEAATTRLEQVRAELAALESERDAAAALIRQAAQAEATLQDKQAALAACETAISTAQAELTAVEDTHAARIVAMQQEIDSLSAQKSEVEGTLAAVRRSAIEFGRSLDRE